MATKAVSELRNLRKTHEEMWVHMRAFCIYCMVGDRREVTKCSDPRCSMYPYRLGSKAFKAEMVKHKKAEPYKPYKRAFSGIERSEALGGEL